MALFDSPDGWLAKLLMGAEDEEATSGRNRPRKRPQSPKAEANRKKAIQTTKAAAKGTVDAIQGRGWDVSPTRNNRAASRGANSGREAIGPLFTNERLGALGEAFYNPGEPEPVPTPQRRVGPPVQNKPKQQQQPANIAAEAAQESPVSTPEYSPNPKSSPAIEQAIEEPQQTPVPEGSYDPYRPLIHSLAGTESSLDGWGATNNVWGSGGRGHFGRLQFSRGRLQDYNRATGADVTPETLLGNPELQRDIENWHFRDIDNRIQNAGLDKYIGQTINGVEITADGIRAGAHIGGFDGVKQYLDSGGKYNPADDNGKRIGDYVSEHANPQSSVDPRVASTGGAGGPAIDPNTLPGRAPQGPQSPPAWLPEGYGSVQEWITEPLSQERGMQVGPFRLYPKEMLGSATSPEEAMRRRAMIAQAMSPPGMTPYQEAQIRLQRDRLNQDILEREYDRISGGAGGTVTGGAGGAGGTDGKYGDIGVTGRREAADRDRKRRRAIGELADLEDLYLQAEEEGAIGGNFGEATMLDQISDRTGYILGHTGSERDLAIRNRVKALNMDKVFDALERFVGNTTNFELDKAALTVPDVNAPDEERRRFVQKLKREVARGLYDTGQAESLEEAMEIVENNIRLHRESMDPSNRIDRGMDDGALEEDEEIIDSYMP